MSCTSAICHQFLFRLHKFPPHSIFLITLKMLVAPLFILSCGCVAALVTAQRAFAQFLTLALCHATMHNTVRRTTKHILVTAPMDHLGLFTSSPLHSAMTSLVRFQKNHLAQSHYLVLTSLSMSDRPKDISCDIGDSFLLLRCSFVNFDYIISSSDDSD